jgi:ADP-heptose:LPS heptosyltransferase/glycosyltransferase involved in cell wall biosynthesis
MKAKFRGIGKKTIVHDRKTYEFTEKWTDLSDLFLFVRLKRYPETFDTVCHFDHKAFLSIDRLVKIEKGLVLTSDKIAIRKLERMAFVVRQAIREDGTHIFRIVNWSDKKLSEYEKSDHTVNALVYRKLGGLGDVIMTFPAIEYAKKKNPNYKITYSCPPEFLPLAENNPFVDNFEPWNDTITKRDWDIVIDLTKDCIKYEMESQPDVVLNRSEVFMQSAGFDPKKTPRPKLYLSGDEYLPIGNDKLNIGLILESNANVRTWPGIYNLRKKLHDEYGEKITTYDICKHEPKNYSQTNGSIPVFGNELREIGKIISKCDLVIGPDTGPMHMASALGIPTLWLFTHIDGNIRTKNYDLDITHFIQGKCPTLSKPCWYAIPCGGNMAEGKTNPECSKSISVDSVLKKAKLILSKSLVSYCVVYHNDKNIYECLDRIRKTKRKTDQVVVANNNCKTFGKNNVAQMFPDSEFAYIENDKNVGCVIARNQAMKAASGIYVFTLDDDQFVNPDSLHKLQSIEADIVGTEAWSMDSNGYAYKIDDNKGPLAYVGGGGLLIKRKVAELAGWLDEGYAPAWFEDADFCYKAVKAGFTIGYHPNPNIEHLGHGTINGQNDFNSQKAWENNHKRFCEKWFKRIVIGGRRPKINIAIDVESWAWHFKAVELSKRLSDDFEFDFVFNGNSECDLYFSFERKTPSDPKTPYITGITAHVWKNIPNFEKICRNSRAIHANSKMLYDEIKHLNSRCHYLPNGVNDEKFGYSERDITKPFIAGYVGKDHKRKGLADIIIPACKLAGVELRAQAARHDSANRLDHSQMPDYYKGVDVILIASDMDGTPNQLLEAASVGRCFIANKIGNVPEFFNGENGLIIKNRTDVNEYATALKCLANNRQLCLKAGKAARMEIEKNWTWKKMAENYRKMFWECL